MWSITLPYLQLLPQSSEQYVVQMVQYQDLYKMLGDTMQWEVHTSMNKLQYIFYIKGAD